VSSLSTTDCFSERRACARRIEITVRAHKSTPGHRERHRDDEMIEKRACVARGSFLSAPEPRRTTKGEGGTLSFLITREFSTDGASACTRIRMRRRRQIPLWWAHVRVMGHYACIREIMRLICISERGDVCAATMRKRGKLAATETASSADN